MKWSGRMVPSARQFQESRSRRGHREHKLGPKPFQLGGSAIFATANVDLFVHVSKSFGDNASPATLFAALDRIEYPA